MITEFSIFRLFSTWFKSVDILNIFLIILLASLGLLFVTTASPSIAKLKNLDEFYFVKKHGVFMMLSLMILICFSFFSKKFILNLSFFSAFFFYLLMIYSLYQNQVNNGASRWVIIFGYSIQPSELLKPFLIVIQAYLISRKNKFRINSFLIDGKMLAFLVLVITSLILFSQPNYSMIAILFFVLMSQFFISGFNIRLVALTLIATVAFSVISFFSLAHVKNRIINHIFSDKPNYQVEKSIQAYKTGGLFGVGTGEGKVKKYIPDAHTDFIFPVIAEEYGTIVCNLIIIIIFTIFFRGLYRTSKINNSFSLLASSGLLVLFLSQSLVNICVSLKIIPTTGVTLPLISYGGSSLISMGIVMGIMLSLTRKKFGFI